MARKRHNTWFLSCLLCAGILIVHGLLESARGAEQFLHWFVVPVALCGILVIEDAVQWLRGDVDIFDPIGILGLFGVHFFLLAPLLHVSWNYWIEGVNSPADWRPWLGGMATVNFVGLLAYRVARGCFAGSIESGSGPVTIWILRPTHFRWCLGGGLLLAAGLQLWVYARYGGLLSYISAVEHQENAFLGSSRIAMISESFPILALMGYAVYVSRRSQPPSWATLLLVLVVFGALKILFGGLHGSRSNIAFAMFCGVGIVHFCIRPVPKKLVLGGGLVLVVFLYVYGFYKSGGVHGLQRALASSQSRAAVESEIRRPIESTILGDLGRSDVQAFLLYRLTQPDSDYEYAYGRSYVGGLVTIIPGPLWRNRPPTKVKEGTEALYGRGTYRERAVSATHQKDKYVGRSSRVYGLAGEAMLNFGPLGVPVAFAVFGVIVSYIRRCIIRSDRQDSRRLMFPLLVNLCLVMLIGDSNNIVALLSEDGAFPFLVLAAGSITLHRAGKPAAAKHGAGNARVGFVKMPLEGS